MKILITGAKGFIGTHLTKALQREGYEVAGTTRYTVARAGVYPLDVQYVQANGTTSIKLRTLDITDHHAIVRILKEEQPDVICHLAAITSVAYSWTHPVESANTNYLGTVMLAEAARLLLPALQGFLFAGTVEQYGNHQEEDYPLTEQAEQRPCCPYALHKASAEQYLRYLFETYHFPYISLRQANIYGREPPQDYFIVEKIISSVLKGGGISLGDDRPTRDFLHIDDLVEAWVTIIKQLPVGECFNVSSNTETSIGELFCKIKAAQRERERTIQNISWNRSDRPNELWRLWIDNAKMKALGWKPRITLDEGLRRTIGRWRSKSP